MPNDTDPGDRYFTNRNSLLLLFFLVKLGGMAPKLLGVEVAVQNPATVYATGYVVIATLASFTVLLVAGMQIDRHGPRRIALLCCYGLMVVYPCAGFTVWIFDGVAGAWLWVFLANALFYTVEMAGAVLVLRMIPRSRLPGFNVLAILMAEAVILSSIVFVVWGGIMPGIAPLSAMFLIGVGLLATIGCAAILTRFAGDGISDHGFPNEIVVAVFDRSAPAEPNAMIGALFDLWRDASCRSLYLAGIVFSVAIATGAMFLVYPEIFVVSTQGIATLVYIALMALGVLLGAASFHVACVRGSLSFGAFLMLCVCLCGVVLSFLFRLQEGFGAIGAIVVLQAGLTGFALALTALFQRLVPVALFGRALAAYHTLAILFLQVIPSAARSVPALQAMGSATICGIALLLTGVMLLLSPLVRKESRP